LYVVELAGGPGREIRVLDAPEARALLAALAVGDGTHVIDPPAPAPAPGRTGGCG
jgi:hypothetical protein